MEYFIYLYAILLLLLLLGYFLQCKRVCCRKFILVFMGLEAEGLKGVVQTADVAVAQWTRTDVCEPSVAYCILHGLH